MISAPPVTPPDARFASASDATLVPTVDLNVTAPRMGYITDADSIAPAAASMPMVAKRTPSSARMSCASARTSIRCEIGRALIAAHVADARLQQRLGDGQDALAAKLLAGAEPQMLDFLCKRPLRHRSLAIASTRCGDRHVGTEPHRADLPLSFKHKTNSASIRALLAVRCATTKARATREPCPPLQSHISEAPAARSMAIGLLGGFCAGPHPARSEHND